MRNIKLWLAAACLAAVLGGAAVVTDSAKAQPAAPSDHWRYFDGRWSYWNSPDQRWYYTDGQNWFYYGDNAWNVYRFVRRFGRDAFERGDYRIPATGVDIVTPRHKIYVAPRR